MIKKIRFEIQSNRLSEMAHLEFFKNDEALKVDLNAKTLTLKSGEVINISATASNVYGGGWEPIRCFSAAGSPAHDYECWASSSYGQNWLELEFTPALPRNFANKLTFCCGEDHGTFPGTYTLFFIDENGNREQIGQPLSVNAHNGIFEWVSIIRCTRGKDGNYYFLRPDAANTSNGSTT